VGPEIAVIGAGGYDAEQITLRAARVLGSTSAVYTAGLPAGTLRHLCKFGPPVFPLEPLFDPPAGSCAAVARFLCAAALRSGHVCYVVTGNPVCYNYVLPYLQPLAQTQGIVVRHIAGVSALDNVCIALSLDIGHTGVQVIDAGRILRRELSPNPGLPLFLFAVGYTRAPRTEPGPDPFNSLYRALALHYPDTWPVVHVRCANGFGDKALIQQTKLRHLAALAKGFDFASTMFLPAMSQSA